MIIIINKSIERELIMKSEMIVNPKIKRTLAVLLAVAIAFFTVMSGADARNVSAAENGVTDNVSSVNCLTILGNAVPYGIVSNKLVQSSHMETTFAVNVFDHMSTNNDIDLCGTGVVGVVYAETTPTSELVRFSLPGPGYFSKLVVETTAEEIAKGYILENSMTSDKLETVAKTKDEINSKVNGMINYAVAQSSALASKTTLTSSDVGFFSAIGEDMNIQVIDLSAYEGKTVYINVPATDNVFYERLANGIIKIRKPENTVVVFNLHTNLDADSTLQIGRINVFIGDSETALSSEQDCSGNDSDRNKEVDKQICQKVVWNILDAQKVVIDTVAGIFISPRTDSNIVFKNSAGWIMSAGTVSNDGGAEFHYIYHGATTPETGSLVINKSVSGAITEAEYNGALTFQIKNETTGEYLQDKNGTLAATAKSFKLNDEYFVRNAEGSYTLTVTGVPVGTYTVTESNADIANYTRVTKIAVGAGTATQTDTASAVVAKDATTTVNITNEYTSGGGSNGGGNGGGSGSNGGGSGSSGNGGGGSSTDSYDFSCWITKYDNVNNRKIEGATLELYEVNGDTQTLIATWVSSATTVYEFKSQANKQYTIKETNVPHGYVNGVFSISFKLDASGNIIITDGNAVYKDGMIYFYNDPIRLTAPKTGDDSHMILWISIMIGCLTEIVAYFVLGRKKKNH